MSSPHTPNSPTSSPSAAPRDGDPESESSITLQQLLKLAGWVASGGEAKVRVQAGEVSVNGEVETRRRRQLHSGDRVALDGLEMVVELEPEDDQDE